MAKKTIKKNTGRIKKDNEHLIEARAHFMQELVERGMSQKDIAFVFNVHPSQVTRSLKIK